MRCVGNRESRRRCQSASSLHRRNGQILPVITIMRQMRSGLADGMILATGIAGSYARWKTIRLFQPQFPHRHEVNAMTRMGMTALVLALFIALNGSPAGAEETDKLLRDRVADLEKTVT